MITLKNLYTTFSNSSKKRIKKNFFSQISLNFFLVIIQILFPPLMIIIYGLENFGIWIFLTAIPYTFSILNINLNTAAKTEMSIFYNKKKMKIVNQIFLNSSVLTILLLIILSLLSVFIFYIFNLDLEILKSLSKKEIKIILTCIIISFLINIFNNIFKVGLTYKGKLDLDVYIEIFTDFITKLLILLSGALFKDLVFAAYAFLFSNILKNLIFYYYFIINRSGLSFNLNQMSIIKMVNLLKLSIPYYLETISGILKNSYQIIILGLFFSPQVVGLVSTLKTLFYFLPIRVWGIVGKVIFYEFTRLYSLKKKELLKNTYLKFIQLCILFLFLFLFFSLLFGKFFYNLWLNNAYEFGNIILLLILLDACVFIFSGSIIFVNKSINKFFRMSFFQLIINLLVIITTYTLFYLDNHYIYIFICNLIGSCLIFVYSIFSAMFLFKKIN